MDMFTNGFTLETFLALLRRRQWIGLSVFFILSSLLASAIIFLPNIYTSQALILIESQQIPQEYIHSPVTKAVERRLQEISQDLLSRSKLEQMSEQFGLYQQLKKTGASSETVAKAMRKDIGINVINGRAAGDTVAFGVSYSGPDPQKAMRVANQLASLYIEANMQIRERQATGTSEFLAKQVESIKAKLEQQEALVTEYKRQHMGELPEQRDANLRIIDSLQKQMILLSDNIARAQERRNVVTQMVALESELAEVEMPLGEKGSATLPSSPEQQMKTLKGQLTQLQVRFSEKHPDVIHLKQLIAKLESSPDRTRRSSKSEASETSRAVSRNAATRSASTRIELSALDAEVQRLNGDVRKMGSDIAMYQQRVENTPRVEQELLSITRDYNTTRDNYISLFKRLDEAKLADKLEETQKAEKFKVLEPAFLPEKPATPERIKLFLGALFLSLVAAVGGMFLREMLDSSFHDVDVLRRSVKIPVLVTIPRIFTTADLWHMRMRQAIGATALALSILVIIGVVYRVVAGNEQMARSLLGSGSINALLRE